MKRIIVFVSLIYLLSGISTVKSQDATAREQINYINTLLKANPYRDTFLEITFFYSINITPEKELVVNMEFDGPFKTVLKAKIPDLGNSFVRDTSYEGNSSVCWYCKPNETTKDINCVYNETITSETDKESHFSDNICVMFARDSNIRDELIKAFDKLFQRILEQ